MLGGDEVLTLQVEAAERVIWERSGYSHGWESASSEAKSKYFEMARAVLIAAKEVELNALKPKGVR